MKKMCPSCGRSYGELDNFCTKCGIELVKEPNRCSKKKTALCATKTFADDDLYCSICGSPTTYWEDEISEREKW